MLLGLALVVSVSIFGFGSAQFGGDRGDVSLSPDASQEVLDGVQKLTHYAEEYETGNIDYVQLLVYISSVREDLNEGLGAVGKDQIRAALGDEGGSSKWVWNEYDQTEKKLDEEVPFWEKIVFDGNEIQIRLNAYPFLLNRGGEELLVYGLHFDVEFKKPEEQLDIAGRLDEVQSLAEAFSADPSRSNAEALAEESVNVERAFESYFRQGSANCEVLMNDIFGSENKRETQQILSQEIEFYEGDNFEAIVNLEMCDVCEWNWININMWIEGRGPGFRYPEGDFRESRGKYESMDFDDFERETRKLVERMRESLGGWDFESANRNSNELNMLTNAWNENANNVWEEFDDSFEDDFETMTDEERMECDRTYCWIKRDQERRRNEENLRIANYERRKAFYLDLFSGYEKDENYFESIEWEKRLVEEFKVNGEEMCSNNVDDNDNGLIDCADAQCGGKVCGQLVEVVETRDDGSSEMVTDLYCIAGTCQVKEDIVKPEGPVCGNNICEVGEMGELEIEEEDEEEDELLSFFSSPSAQSGSTHSFNSPASQVPSTQTPTAHKNSQSSSTSHVSSTQTGGKGHPTSSSPLKITVPEHSIGSCTGH